MTKLLISVMLLTMLAALVACVRVPYSSWKLRTVLLFSVVIGLLTELLANYFREMGVVNSIVFNVYIAVEYLLVLGMVHSYQPRWRGPLIGAGLFGMGFLAVNAFVQDPTVFLLVETVLVMSVVHCIVLVLALWNAANTSDLPLYHVPEFWLFMGLLIYFGGMVPVIGMVRFLFQQDQHLAARLYLIVPYLCITRYAFTTYACICARRAASGPHG